jgi:hypothetical protein
MKLTNLQKSGKYVFHGSSDGSIIELEPRQAMSHGKPYGKPAIYADIGTQHPIFMAVLGSKKVGGWGDKSLPRAGFYIDKGSWEKAHRENWVGYIYVLSKGDFTKQEGNEWVSYEEVKPIEIIKVGINDLPKDITIR